MNPPLIKPGSYESHHLPSSSDGVTIHEPARDVPVIADVDVAILGGGPAGVCAALAAAEMGRFVLLVERHGFLGGNATAAMVNHWHSLYVMDRRTKVIGGLAERSNRTLQREGWKLVQYPGEPGRVLINSVDDPAEMHNLAGQGHPAETELTGRLLEWACSAPLHRLPKEVWW